VVAVAFTTGASTVVRRPGREIGSSHGRPGAVGWTTPHFNVNLVPPGRSMSASFTASTSFDMELASEYTGQRGAVLADHEQGHVNIGNRVARAAFTNMKTVLQGYPSLNESIVTAEMQTAIDNATTDEAAESLRYDSTDYPRMNRAYEGARTPLARLARTRDIGRMSRALTAMASGPAPTHHDFVAKSSEIIRARQALSTDSNDKLAYNAEFQTLVAQARSAADSAHAYLQSALPRGTDGSPAPGEGSSEEGHEVALAHSMLIDTLGSFRWSAPT
jgi:hypothetical protein